MSSRKWVGLESNKLNFNYTTSPSLWRPAKCDYHAAIRLARAMIGADQEKHPLRAARPGQLHSKCLFASASDNTQAHKVWLRVLLLRQSLGIIPLSLDRG